MSTTRVTRTGTTLQLVWTNPSSVDLATRIMKQLGRYRNGLVTRKNLTHSQKNRAQLLKDLGIY